MAFENYTGSTIAKTALLTNIHNMLTELYTYATEIENARDGESTLLDQIDSLQSLISTVTSEVTNARDGEATLLAQIDALQASIAALTVGTGCPVSSNDTTPGYLNGKLVVGDGIEFTENNDGGDETLSVASSFASQAQAEAGTNETKVMNPLRTKQAIDALATQDWELDTELTVTFDDPTADDITETWMDGATEVATRVTEFGTAAGGEEQITETFTRNGVTTETVTVFETDGSITITKEEVA